jgi:hypothetical protein
MIADENWRATLNSQRLIRLSGGPYLSKMKTERAVLKNMRPRHLRGRGYRAVRFENEPMFALFGALMWPLIRRLTSNFEDRRGLFRAHLTLASNQLLAAASAFSASSQRRR